MLLLKVSLIAAFLCFISGCASIEDKWQSAKSTDTIIGYQLFITENQETAFSKKARLKIMELKWKEAQTANSLEFYANFLNTYPSGELSDKAQLKIMHINWLYAKNKNTLESYMAFLKKYPTGDLARTAKSKIMEIEWDVTKTRDSILDYEQFLKKHPVSEHTLDSYHILKAHYAKIDWKMVQSERTKGAYLSFLIKHPRSKFALSAYKKIEEIDDLALSSFRKTVAKQIKKQGMKNKDIISIFAIFLTDEPSFFVVKKSSGIFYKSYDHNFMPYHQAARLPLICSAKPFEGIVLFVNRKFLETPKETSGKIRELLFPEYNLYRMKKLRQTNDEYRILWPLGKSAKYIHEVTLNTFEFQKYQLLPESRQVPVIEKLAKNIEFTLKNDLDQNCKLLANQILLYLKTEKHQTPCVKIETDIEFYAENEPADCKKVDEIQALFETAVFEKLNFYKAQDSNPDLLIDVKLKAEGIMAYYGRKYRAYTSAKTSGTIKAEIPGVASETEPLKGYQKPSSSINTEHYSILGQSYPCSAPFTSAIGNSDYKKALETGLFNILGDRLIKKK